jgi:hypothetical protein
MAERQRTTSPEQRAKARHLLQIFYTIAPDNGWIALTIGALSRGNLFLRYTAYPRDPRSGPGF